MDCTRSASKSSQIVSFKKNTQKLCFIFNIFVNSQTKPRKTDWYLWCLSSNGRNRGHQLRSQQGIELNCKIKFVNFWNFYFDKFNFICTATKHHMVPLGRKPETATQPAQERVLPRAQPAHRQRTSQQLGRVPLRLNWQTHPQRNTRGQNPRHR